MGDTADMNELPALDGGVRYTMAEAARIKGVSYHTVSRAVRSGKLPAQRLGRMALIAAADLQAWRPMRERAPRKYRRSDPATATGEGQVAVASEIAGGYIDRLGLATEQLLAVASAESTADFGSWLARWLAYSLQVETAVIWSMEEPHARARLFGVYGADAQGPPQVIEGAPVRALSEQDDVAPIDKRTATRFRLADWFAPLDGGQPIFVPLRSGSRCVGCALVARKGQGAPWSAEEGAFALRLGYRAAFAMEHVELREFNRSATVVNDSVLHAVPLQIVAVDMAGTFVYANRAFIDRWGEDYYRRYVSRHYTHLQRSYRVETLDGVEVRLEDNPLTVALRGDRVDHTLYLVPEAPGETCVLDVNAMPTFDEEGMQTGAIMSLREVTESFTPADGSAPSPVELLADARRRVEMLANLSNEISQRRNSEDIFEIVASRASDILEADAAVVMTSAANNRMHVRAVHNVQTELVGREMSRFAFPMGILAMAHRDIHYVNEEDASPAGRGLLRDAGARSALLVPLVDGEESLGVLALLYRDVDRLRHVDPELARAVGRQCGHAVQLHNVVVELEASRRRLLTTLDQLPQAVIITDEPEGHIVAMNREAQEIWGASPNWLGQHASDIVVLDEQGRHYPADQHPFLRPLRTRTTEFGVPLITRDANGEHTDVVANIAPVVGRNGELRGAVAVLQRREHFKPIDQAKDEFISVVAHELRNPLTSLRGNLQMLERRLKRMETDAATREIERVAGVIEQVDRVGDLVSRMLDVSRADLGKLTIAPGPADAVQLARGVIGDLESQLGDRRIHLNAPESVPVEWDSVRIQQILINLVTNAIRYAPEGNIDVMVSQGEDDSVAISVRDRGPGVPMRLQRRLFRLYYRFDDGEESAEGLAIQQRGLGIGLYISARLARAHGGDLSVDDADGGGAIFMLRLPRVATQETELEA